ncbi:MAG: glycosyltransferase [Rhodococcus sp. (in: high G+C Gram-positive bacteria)]
MKIVLPFTGSRGDVQPGLALAVELAGRGHSIEFGAPPNLVPFAAAATASTDGITVVPFGPDTKALLESELVRTRIKARNPRTRLAALAELANFGWDEMTQQLSKMAVGADAVITGTLGQEMAFNTAEAMGVPFIALHYCPIRLNGSMSVIPGRQLPAAVNRATWRLLETTRWRSMKKRENQQRHDLGLRAATAPFRKEFPRTAASRSRRTTVHCSPVSSANGRMSVRSSVFSNSSPPQPLRVPTSAWARHCARGSTTGPRHCTSGSEACLFATRSHWWTRSRMSVAETDTARW